MTTWLKQSTAADVEIGPFVDDTDFKTVETGLTISQADVQLIKNGGSAAQKNDATSATHLAGGHYKVPLNATDTGTLGRLRVHVNESGALPAWRDFMVVPSAVYDSLVGGTDYLEVDAVAVSGDTTAANNLEAAADGTGYNLGNGQIVAFQVSGAVGSISGGGISSSSFAAGAITAAAIATGAIDADAIAADAVTEIQSGLATGAAVAALNDLDATETAAAVWNAARSGYTAAGSFGQGIASVQGNVTGSVLSVTNGVTVASIGNGAITAAAIATNAIDADALATDAVTELVNAFWTNASRTLTAATNITSTGSPIVLHTDNRVLLAGTTHTSAVIPTVNALAAAAYSAIAAEILATAVPGSFLSGTVGHRIGTNLDATISGIHTAIGSLPDAPDIRAEIDGGIEAYRLHELLHSELGSAPAAASLFGELTEDDGGTRRFTANALEMGPSGEGASPATIAAEVWNSALASYQLAGSTGEALGTAAAGGGSGSDPWSVSLPGSYTGAQAGKMLGDILTATVALPSAATVRSELETVGSKLDLAYAAVTSGALFGNVGAIKAKTDALPAAPASTGDIPTAAAIRAELDAASTRLAGIHQNSIDVVETLAGGGYFHGLIDGIRARTDLLPSSPAATGDIPSPAAVAAAVLGSPVPAAYGAGTLGHVVGSRLDAVVSAGHAVLDSVKAKTDLIPAVPLTAGDVATLLSGLKLDQLLASPATTPVAGSFLGQMLEAPAGSYRFKAAALAQAPAAQLSVDAGEIAAGVWDAALVAHAGAGTFGARVNSLTSLSAAQLQDAVWLAGPDSHGSQPGTFGWMLDARISGLLPNSAGTGAVTFVYAVTNGINQQPIPEVVVTVSTDAQGQAVVARARTALDGTCTFYLNPGTHYFWRAKSGWAFVNPDVETVTEAG
jgi:hypothetical protein